LKLEPDLDPELEKIYEHGPVFTLGKILIINNNYNAYHNTLDTMCVYIPSIICGGSTMQ